MGSKPDVTCTVTGYRFCVSIAGDLLSYTISQNPAGNKVRCADENYLRKQCLFCSIQALFYPKERLFCVIQRFAGPEKKFHCSVFDFIYHRTSFL